MERHQMLLHIPPPIRLLLETKHVLLVDKPPGVPFHQIEQGEGKHQPGLLQLGRREQAAGRLPGGLLFPVHR